MPGIRLVCFISSVLVFCARGAVVEAGNDSGRHDGDHILVVGVGGALELELGEGSLQPGANAFIEVRAIEGWLELELGISTLAAGSGIEVPIDLLFKKPFRLSRHVELMIGLGPELVYFSASPRSGAFVGGELALDFMFWPSQRVGLWVQPSYDLIFRHGIQHGLGTTAGLLVGW